MPEKLITVKDASELLSINPFSLYKMALQRKIPSVKLGKLRRFKESEYGLGGETQGKRDREIAILKAIRKEKQVWQTPRLKMVISVLQTSLWMPLQGPICQVIKPAFYGQYGERPMAGIRLKTGFQTVNWLK